jgi:hypothetical protein
VNSADREMATREGPRPERCPWGGDPEPCDGGHIPISVTLIDVREARSRDQPDYAALGGSMSIRLTRTRRIGRGMHLRTSVDVRSRRRLGSLRHR